MEQGDEHLCTHGSPEQVSPATTTVDQEKKSFTDKEKAILRQLLLDLIFSEPRVKNKVS
jgi:hypothetical protein